MNLCALLTAKCVIERNGKKSIINILESAAPQPRFFERAIPYAFPILGGTIPRTANVLSAMTTL